MPGVREGRILMTEVFELQELWEAINHIDDIYLFHGKVFELFFNDVLDALSLTDCSLPRETLKEALHSMITNGFFTISLIPVSDSEAHVLLTPTDKLLERYKGVNVLE
jgi:hypothetical protein